MMDANNENLKDIDIGPPARLVLPYASERSTAGSRITIDSLQPFPNWMRLGAAPCFDSDGSPIFLGSAVFNNSVHPCKVGPHLQPPCRVSYGGSEVKHYGRYSLLSFDNETMEWVPTSHGRIPAHRRPVQGGYEENGAKLYHALAAVHGTSVHGKTGEHLGGCTVAYGGREHHFRDGYYILFLDQPDVYQMLETLNVIQMFALTLPEEGVRC